MKVAILTSFPQDLSSPQGGVESVSVNLVKALAELNDMEIHVVTFDSKLSATQKNSINGFQVHRLPAPSGSVLLTAMTSGRRIISAYLKKLKPDLIHSHDTYGLMVKEIEIPRVFTVHGFIYADTLVSGTKFPKFRSRIWRWAETNSWADQSHIIAISPYVRDRVSRVAKGVIHDIENPVAEAFFALERKEDPGIVFSSAVISPRKNTLALIDAFRMVADEGRQVQLRLAGRIIDPEYGRLVEERIQKMNIRSKVSLLGAISSERVKSELSRSAVYALISLEENAPMGIEEAMAAGVPVLTSNCCGMPFMVRHGETGFLVDPKDIYDIAARLRVLLDNQSLRKNMGVRARVHALDRYYPQKVALRTKDVYKEAIRSPHFVSSQG